MVLIAINQFVVGMIFDHSSITCTQVVNTFLLAIVKTIGLIILTRKSTDDLNTNNIFLQTVGHIANRIIHSKEQLADLRPKTGCHQSQVELSVTMQ